jgi:hypothetical protein
VALKVQVVVVVQGRSGLQIIKQGKPVLVALE